MPYLRGLLAPWNPLLSVPPGRRLLPPPLPACRRLQVCRVRATAAAEKPAEVSNYADEFTREIVDEEKK